MQASHAEQLAFIAERQVVYGVRIWIFIPRVKGGRSSRSSGRGTARRRIGRVGLEQSRGLDFVQHQQSH